ncbi:cache domain-containing sensor histidine kinase [Gracilibacillus dipsosauri]|uniref:Two-component sensor histidine kinase n=1 Tax=Gracilibacillus dipsosauri TaxID=178340 RepID=A0A317KSU7_9BACI|nr:sensor histidine kinase [Gracilibacillus dipsosauri]PWU66631.1 two-component sensor histidine kinase [Gracilibacillus dipsosauri]
MKLRNKLFISFVLVVFIPVIIIGGYLTNELRQVALEEAEKQATINMERVKERTLEVLKVPVYLADNISIDKRFIQLVNKEYQSVYDVVDAYWQYDTLKYYQDMYSSEISNIRFYMDNPTLLNNWEIIPVSKELKGKDWYQHAMNKDPTPHWLYLKDETKNNYYYLSLVRKITSSEFDTNGLLVINVNTKTLNRILSQESEPILLVDEQNDVIATNQKEFRGKKLNSILTAPEVMEGELGIFQDVTSDESKRIFVDEISLEKSDNKLRIISIISDETIVQNAQHFGKMGATVVMISVSVALIIIYYLSKLLSNRLIILTKQINQVAKGNFETSIVIDGNDEIGMLSKQLDVMVSNTRNLLAEVYESNKQKRLLERRQNEIKFKMMASQINPHFLFNCLESIRMEAHYKGEKEIARVIKLLGKLMRNSIEVGSGKIKLESEIEVIEWYLEIQKFRYDERLNYYLDIDPDTRDFLIPPLIIQPLVENSVIHGLEGNRSGGTIHVKTQLVEGGLYVEVSDNGIGITKQKLDAIIASLSEKEEKSGVRIGLRNVHQRIQLTYGARTGLSIQSIPNVGTNISFHIK